MPLLSHVLLVLILFRSGNRQSLVVLDFGLSVYPVYMHPPRIRIDTLGLILRRGDCVVSRSRQSVRDRYGVMAASQYGGASRWMANHGCLGWPLASAVRSLASAAGLRVSATCVQRKVRQRVRITAPSWNRQITDLSVDYRSDIDRMC